MWHAYTANGHYKGMVITLWLGKGPNIVVLLRKYLRERERGSMGSGLQSEKTLLFLC